MANEKQTSLEEEERFLAALLVAGTRDEWLNAHRSLSTDDWYREYHEWKKTIQNIIMQKYVGERWYDNACDCPDSRQERAAAAAREVKRYMVWLSTQTKNGT